MRTIENTLSPTREVGLGNSKNHIGRIKKQVQYTTHEGRLICPDCGERTTEDIIERRWNYFECRSCNYENDVDYWYKVKN